jgi:hypothetical protein
LSSVGSITYFTETQEMQRMQCNLKQNSGIM